MDKGRHAIHHGLIGVLIIFFIMSCGASRKVSRVGTSEATDLSGRWNDTDSRLVAEAMIRDILKRPWLDDFSDREDRKPRMIVGTVINRSHEHIAVQTFVKDLERELINSGKVSFVASKSERQEVREERDDQQMEASEETAKRLAQEAAADYMLRGSLNTILDESGDTKVIFYQTNLELIDIESSEKVWIGQKKIKKVVERSSYKY
ncbi:MAG: penicillin-binding protein activator LpoB [SAR324 cluster bacterium]|nr:penicillin-binding protein activator LpoB [SAR324 cluster bacterium]